MNVKKLMGLAVVLVALAVAVNALAFKTANVSNTSSITVDATNAAALKITAGTGSGFTSTIGANGYLDLVISQKMQPNSDYLFGPVFTVTNTNGAIVNLSYTVSGNTNGVQIDLFKDANGGALPATLAATSGATDVYVKVTVPDTFVGTGGGTLNSSQTPKITITAKE
jgi:hypothetical protein